MVGQPLVPPVAGLTRLWGVCLESLGATLGTGYQAIWVLVGGARPTAWFIMHCTLTLICCARAAGFFFFCPPQAGYRAGPGLGGSSCMVKNEGKGRKMTGLQRNPKIVVLLDILKASQTSMAH